MRANIFHKGSSRIEEDIDLMLERNLNIYWKACFKFFTPILAIVSCTFDVHVYRVSKHFHKSCLKLRSFVSLRSRPTLKSSSARTDIHYGLISLVGLRLP